jgi:multisubunit Na+/H+ antiporter MnhB subunit
VSSAGIFALGTSALISYYASWGFGKTASAVCSLSLILWLWLVDIQGMREPYVKDWKPFGMVHKFKLWLFLLLFAITANAVWDWIKWRINQ